MGEIYTCTNNAISLTNTTWGGTGDKGITGAIGSTGNPWAVGVVNPNTLTSFTGEPQLVSIPLIGNLFLPTPMPASGNVLQTGDKFLNNATGEWYLYDSTLADSFKWVLQPTNFKGTKGAHNYKATEVSFTEDSINGWTLKVPYQRQLVGHLIWPGSNIAGNFTEAKVVITTKSETQPGKALIHLVNLGSSATSDLDDIVVASKSAYVSGDGSLSCMRAVDLNINSGNIPTTPEVFGLFVQLTDSEIQGRQNLEQIKTSYNAEIAVNYKQNIEKVQEETRDSFYKILKTHGIYSRNETTEDRNKREQEQREEKIKRDTKSKQDEEAFSADPTKASGSKGYASFRKEGPPQSPMPTPNPGNTFDASITVHHLSLR